MQNNLNNQLYTIFNYTKIMKKINHYVLNGAIALLSTAGFVACSSSDDVTDAPVNPSYDGKSVKTQFAINIATPSNTQTRMTDENTQNKSNSYLGMSHVRLLSYTLESSAAMNDASVPNSVLKLADPDEVKYENSTYHSSHIYSDVNIPVGTNNFLFYSTRKFDTDSKNAETGAISSTLFNSDESTTPAPTVTSNAAIEFTAVKILNDKNSIDDQTTAFAKYLNDVLASKVDDSNKWSTLGETQDESTLSSAAQKTLRKAYINFTAKYNDAQRAGSANAIRLQMQDLYNVVVGLKAADGTEESAITDENKLAAAICTAILNESGTNIKFSYQADDTDPDNPKGTLSYASGLDDKYTNFPCEQGLPEGAALLTYDSNSGFSYVDNGIIGSSSTTGAKKNVGVTDITYPLPIVYFCNTPVKAGDEEIAKSEWQTTTSTWDSWAKWSTWAEQVKLSTRSIALRNNINYGVAGLVTTVKCATKQLEDNKGANISGESNQIITIPTDGFKVTGLIIGGQPSKVNWQFVDEFTPASGSDRPNVVYDNVTNNALASTTESSKIYTLVFDNWKSVTGSDTQEAVNVAIELENGDTEFYGQEGIIAARQKFYLVGQLNPANASNLSGQDAFAWPTYPDSYTGSNGTLPKSYEGRYPVKTGADNNRVFIQDYTTTAKFTISSLKNAYVTIPDLRATKLQLGLSVDLTWQSGLTFNVPID